MYIHRFRLVALFALAAACAPAPQAADTAADEQAIQQVREQEIAALSSGNLDALTTLVTQDGYMMPPGEPAVVGREAGLAWAKAMIDQFTVTGRYTSAHVQVLGDVAIERYTAELSLTPKAGGAAMTETIKGIHIYQRQADGSWQIAQDVWNSDAPPPAAPPPTTTGQ